MLSCWNYIRTDKYKYINDIEMYWSMALVGDFMHVPKNLVSWRQHKGQISVDRVESIKECEEWFNEYFARKDLPEGVINIKDKVRETIIRYFINLIENSSLDLDKKREIIKHYKKELSKIKTIEKQIIFFGIAKDKKYFTLYLFGIKISFKRKNKLKID